MATIRITVPDDQLEAMTAAAVQSGKDMHAWAIEALKIAALFETVPPEESEAVVELKDVSGWDDQKAFEPEIIEYKEESPAWPGAEKKSKKS